VFAPWDIRSVLVSIRIPLILLYFAGNKTYGDPETAPAVEEFLKAFIERFATRVAVVKPQSAFLSNGLARYSSLERIVTRSHELGLLVVLDAKRGDIDSTAAAYAAYLDPMVHSGRCNHRQPISRTRYSAHS